MKTVCVLMSAIVGLLLNVTASLAEERPNIVWIIADDLSPELGCYGYRGVATPNIDKLAEAGTRYTSAFSTAPVCSTSRSALITGVYQTSTGTHHHRTLNKQPLPAPVKPITELLRDVGYYVCNANSNWTKAGKQDYNFEHDGDMYDGVDWSVGDGKRKANQPFFAQVQIHEPHRNFVTAKDRHRADDVEIPSYYPDHPIVRADWADYLATVEVLDRKVGDVLRRLEDDGLADSTVVVFFGDHGRPHYRDKQWLYDGGIRIPLVIRVPDQFKMKQVPVSDRLVCLLDVAALTLGLAELPIPQWMDGKDMLSENFTGRDVVFAARDRSGSTLDRARCLRTSRFKYIRNFHPDRPYSQHSGYKRLQYPGQTVAQVLHKQGGLSPAAELFWKPTRPVEELYDVLADPEELRNLAADPRYAGQLESLRKRLNDWIDSSGDQGREAEQDLESTIALSESWYRKQMRKRGLDPDVPAEEYLEWWAKQLLE